MSFGSPTNNHVEENLDLNRFLVPHRASTYFLKVSGDAMKDAGIMDGDFLIVDRSINIEHGQIIVTEQDGELIVRRFQNQNNQICLMPENEKYKPVFLRDPGQLIVWGTVSSVFRKLY